MLYVYYADMSYIFVEIAKTDEERRSWLEMIERVTEESKKDNTVASGPEVYDVSFFHLYMLFTPLLIIYIVHILICI